MLKTIQDFIDWMKLPFRKDRQLRRSFYDILGFYPHDIKPYRQAIVHKSMHVKGKSGISINNERLEFLGDAVLDAVIGDIVFRKFKGRDEGFLTRTRSKIVQRESLGHMATNMGLTRLIRSNMDHHSHNSYMGGNAFEAMVGAVYLDRGFDMCLWFAENRMLGKNLDLKQVAHHEVNFKSKLMEWCQKNKVSVSYEMLEEKSDENTHSPQFLFRVLCGEIECGRAWGYSKKESHQLASKMALEAINRSSSLKIELLENNLIDDNIISETCVQHEAESAGQVQK